MFYCYNEDTEGKQWRLTGKKMAILGYIPFIINSDSKPAI